MPTKTISLELDAYEKLRAAKRFPRESFSEVVRRLAVPGSPLTAREFLEARWKRGPVLSDEDCNSIDRLNAEDLPPEIP